MWVRGLFLAAIYIYICKQASRGVVVVLLLGNFVDCTQTGRSGGLVDCKLFRIYIIH